MKTPAQPKLLIWMQVKRTLLDTGKEYVAS